MTGVVAGLAALSVVVILLHLSWVRRDRKRDREDWY